MTSRVWGYVYEDQSAAAAYFVEWTPGHADRSADFDFIVGEWGDGTDALDRKAVTVEFRHLSTGPAFRIGDASTRQVAHSNLVGEVLDRSQVLQSPTVSHIFTLCDLVYLEDPRLSELRRD